MCGVSRKEIKNNDIKERCGLKEDVMNRVKRGMNGAISPGFPYHRRRASEHNIDLQSKQTKDNQWRRGRLHALAQHFCTITMTSSRIEITSGTGSGIENRYRQGSKWIKGLRSRSSVGVKLEQQRNRNEKQYRDQN
ncbi:hypothetical protein EVAR_24314_1 [Eumeta japonica]|uniref:Uncharacterized protein n=1 Tax=Eumeta variegata TaxID=151549 RepID=A0A4C1VN57_EUMVA|nr:hypothetical protein EVAR_24314_1 [Eumeta japonica]